MDEMLYREPERQQIHYSSRKGWLNDPNGLCWYHGFYHLFHQYNPLGVTWGNMHWNHAISPDLIHWEERGIALTPDQHGTMYSGGAVIDYNNELQLQQDDDLPTLLLYYTCAGKPFTQNIAYSTDGGNTFIKYAGNPVVPNLHGGEERDPAIAFDRTHEVWIMILYLGDDKHEFATLISRNLLDWQETQRFLIDGGGRECPELFEITDKTSGQRCWVLLEANGLYRTGSFDGRQFHFDGAGRFLYRPGNQGAYAGQTFKNAPDGKRVYLAWLQDAIRGEKFSQSLSLPIELKLIGGRLRTFPHENLRQLRQTMRQEDAQKLRLTGDGAFEFAFSTSCGTTTALSIGGVDFLFDPSRKSIRVGETLLPLPDPATPLRWRAYLDRNSVELFEEDGRLYFEASRPTDEVNEPFRALGTTPFPVTVWPLTGIWQSC